MVGAAIIGQQSSSLARPHRSSTPTIQTYGTLVEGSDESRHGHVLASLEDLRAALLAAADGDKPSSLLILRTLDPETTEILQTAAEIDPGFVTAHTKRLPYQPRPGHVKPRWWSWIFPALMKRKGRMQDSEARRSWQKGLTPTFALRGGCEDCVCFHRASLWLSGPVPILLLEQHAHDASDSPSARSPRVIHTGKRSGRPGEMRSLVVMDDANFGLEDNLMDLMRDDTDIAEVIGQLMLNSWLGFIDALSPRTKWEGRKDDGLLWMILRALETNVDTARSISRQGSTLGTVSVDDWTELTERIQRRVELYSLCVSSNTSSQAKSVSGKSVNDPDYAEKNANSRSLDRIAYLGGIMLPVTLVSGVLSIEGSFGPEGAHFWVFWVAALVTAMFVLLVIYVDQVRTLNVWIEVAAGELLALNEEDDDDDSDDDDDEDGRLPLLRSTGEGQNRQTYLVQRGTEGGMARTWQRRELGWGGAVRRICGYERWRGARQGQAPGTRLEKDLV